MGQMSRLQKNTAEVPASREKQTLFVGQFRKTKMCRFHETGRCRYAEKCPFAHSPEELEELPDLRKTSICKNWQQGCCSLSADRCAFAHGKDELRKTQQYGRKKSQDFFDRRDSFEGSEAYASTSEGYHGGSFESDRQSSSSSTDEEPGTPTRQLAWDPLGLGEVRSMSFSPMYNDKWAQGGPLPVMDACLQRTGFDNMAPSGMVGTTIGLPVGPVCPPMGVPAMGQFVLMPGMSLPPVMWEGTSQFAPSGKELEEMLKQAMPTHYDD